MKYAASVYPEPTPKHWPDDDGRPRYHQGGMRRGPQANYYRSMQDRKEADYYHTQSTAASTRYASTQPPTQHFEAEYSRPMQHRRGPPAGRYYGRDGGGPPGGRYWDRAGAGPPPASRFYDSGANRLYDRGGPPADRLYDQARPPYHDAYANGVRYDQHRPRVLPEFGYPQQRRNHVSLEASDPYTSEPFMSPEMQYGSSWMPQNQPSNPQLQPSALMPIVPGVPNSPQAGSSPKESSSSKRRPKKKKPVERNTVGVQSEGEAAISDSDDDTTDDEEDISVHDSPEHLQLMAKMDSRLPIAELPYVGNTGVYTQQMVYPVGGPQQIVYDIYDVQDIVPVQQQEAWMPISFHYRSAE